MERLAAEKHVRDLSPACLKNMGSRLSGQVGKNYKDLAGKLGFVASDVDGFELDDKTNPGYILLKKWSQRDNTTAAVLRYHLEAMERADVIKILDDELEDRVDLIVSIRNEFTSEIIFTGVVPSFGYSTIRHALESNPKIKIMISELRHDSKYPDQSIFERTVASYRGKQLSLKYTEAKTSVEETLSQLSVKPEQQFPAPATSQTDGQNDNPGDTHQPENAAETAASETQEFELSTLCLRDMGLMLSKPFGSNYRDLASRLGWAAADIDSLALANITNPGFVLLQRWFQQPNTTVAQLRQNLLEMNRDDVIDILDAEVRDSFTLEVIVKDQRDSHELFNQVITMHGRCTVQEAIKSKQGICLPFFKLQHENEYYYTSVLQQQADLFKGQRVIFICLEKPIWSGEDVLGYHPQANSDKEIRRIMDPYISYDGAYIVRPSKVDPAKRCITLVNEGDLVSFKIHSRYVQIGERFHCQYFLYEAEQSFASLEDLIAHYHEEKLYATKDARGQCLTVPILRDN